MRNYELFMRDFLEENSPDDFKVLSPVEEIEEAGKEGIYKENYYMKEHLQIPIVSPVLVKRKNRDIIIDFVGSFLDKHATQLSTSGPVYSFTFGEKEIKPVMDLFGLDNPKLLEIYNAMITDTYNGQISKIFTGWIYNAPHKLLLTAMIAESYQKGYDDIIECCEYMYAFTDYPIIYREFWKLGVQEDVMNYTIEHLSSKHMIRQLANLQELLKYDTTNAVVLYKNAFMSAPDNLYNDLPQAVRNRIRSKIKNIANEYYKNIETNATQHTNVSEFDDGELADQEGQTTNTAAIVDKVVSKITSNGVVKSLANTAAEARKVDKSNLEGMIGQIYSTKNNRMDKMVEDILTVYFTKNPTSWSISPREFLNFGLMLYRSIGTSKDPMLIEIKEILNYWMNDIIDINSQYDRPATVINYSRAVFDYVILTINYFS